jgi:outer membrane protein TolC
VGISCRSPSQFRKSADKTAYKAISETQKQALGKTEPFTIERPSDILRRRLLVEQDLPSSSEASLGTDQLKRPKHWPDKGYPAISTPDDSSPAVDANKPLRLSLEDALQIGARNSADYQSQKETVFRAALDLDLERNSFRNIFQSTASSQITADETIEPTPVNLNTTGSAQVTRALKNGAQLTGALAINLASLLKGGAGSATGVTGDASVSIPLLRGAGREIVTEPLVLAERNLMYQIWNFERYKRTFAVTIARSYFDVLRQMDSMANAQANYRSSVQSARWSRRRADAGRMAEIEVDQARQRELSARDQWISAQEQLKSRLDSFKTSLGLPPDALIELDPNDLVRLRERYTRILETTPAEALANPDPNSSAPPADAPVELVPPNPAEAGPLEVGESLAVRLALQNRLDLRVAIGDVYDAQRAVIVAADALRTGLNLAGSVTLVSNDSEGRLKFDGTRYSALLSLDLPIERTRERNVYRTTLISLERNVRSVQTLEDQIKLAVRDDLRSLLESRESLKIQAQSVMVAEKRVKSSTLFLEAGRIQIRDLLDSQDALLSAQNSLTAAFVNYRMAELQLQRDLDVLKVDQTGLWKEISPEELKHGITS